MDNGGGLPVSLGLVLLGVVISAFGFAGLVAFALLSKGF
jgi:hypothetical protein